MKRTYSINNNLPPYLSLKSTDKGYYEPWIEPYFGTGADGDFSTTGNVNLASTVDGPYVIKHYKNLTINSGHIFSLSNRAKGLVLYIEETFTLNGTLSMTAKGGNNIPTTPEKFAIRVIKRRLPPHNEVVIVGYEYLELATIGKIFPQQFQNNAQTGVNGNDGDAGIALGLGGNGGNGGMYSNFHRTIISLAAPGTCYSGGSAAGGLSHADQTTALDFSSAWGKIEGNGGNGTTNIAAGSNPRPAGGGGTPPGSGYNGSQDGDAGKGGSILVFCKTFQGNGTSISAGSDGGDVYYSGGVSIGSCGGGASGGGGQTFRYLESFFTGSILSPGGLKGNGISGSNNNPDGGKGGGGFISVEQIT